MSDTFIKNENYEKQTIQMYIVSVTCHQHAPCIPQFILPLSEFCILISLILLCCVQHNVNIFEILELKNSAAHQLCLSRVCYITSLKKPRNILPAWLKLVPFSLLCGGTLFRSRMQTLKCLWKKLVLVIALTPICCELPATFVLRC